MCQTAAAYIVRSATGATEYRQQDFLLEHMGWDRMGRHVFSLFCTRYKCVWCRALVGVAAVFQRAVTLVDVDGFCFDGAEAAPCVSSPPVTTVKYDLSRKIVFYYCFAGAHASVVAAAIHCTLLPQYRTPTYREIVALPYYDRTEPRYIGTPYFVGKDEDGRPVYCLGLWACHEELVAAMRLFLQCIGIGRSMYLFVNAFALINFSTKLGGMLSKRLGFVAIGRVLSVWGIRRRYAKFVQKVMTVKQWLKATDR